MLTLSLLPLLLATAGLAVPSRRLDQSVPASVLAGLLPTGQNSLIAPTNAPSFVLVGFGTETYTCAQGGTWQFSGEAAQLFNIENLHGGAEFSNIQTDIYKEWSVAMTNDPNDAGFTQTTSNNHGIQFVGKLHSTSSRDGTLSKVWDLSATQGQNAVVTTHVTGETPSPDPTAIPWQELKSVSGGFVNTVFRVQTVWGKAPFDSCEPGYPDTVTKFTAQFFLYQ